ncbi:MAG: hypothetical protein AB7S75_21735 [Desulfococcaceae bacterium]
MEKLETTREMLVETLIGRFNIISSVAAPKRMGNFEIRLEKDQDKRDNALFLRRGCFDGV